QKDERDSSLTTELNEMSPFLCRFGKKDSVVCDYAYRITAEMGKSANQRCTVPCLKFVKFGTIHQAGNHFADIVWLSVIGWNDSVQFFRVRARLGGTQNIELNRFLAIQIRDNSPSECERVRIILSQMVGDPGQPGMDVAATQILRADDLANGGSNQRRS